MGAYASASPAAIRGTLALFRHFREFQASSCRFMNDPTRESWRGAGDGNTMDKAQATARLRWLVNVAINRKAGIPDDRGRGNHAKRRLADMRTRAARARGCFECGTRLGWLPSEQARAMVMRNPRLARDLENFKRAQPGTRLRGWGRYIIRESGDYSRPYRPGHHYCGAC